MDDCIGLIDSGFLLGPMAPTSGLIVPILDSHLRKTRFSFW